jgi:hypothetical protein
VGRAGITYDLVQGATSEVVEVSEVDEETSTLTLESPLANSYTTAATIQLTDADAEEELKGCRDHLASLGVQGYEHFVYPFHHSNAKSRAWIEQWFESARAGERVLNYVGQDVYNLNSFLDTQLTSPDVDSWLQKAKDEDGVMIWYGHAGESTTRLEYLVDKAIELGIPIITRAEAVARLKAS